MASIFTRIIRGEAPAQRLYETEHELAFLDIHPKSTGHTLVVPKHEVASFHELPPERAASLAAAVNVVARAVVAAMGTPHYNLVLNNGAPAGQVVFHVHMHIIPRYGSAPFGGGPGPHAPLPEVAASIRAALRALPEAASLPGRVVES